MNIYPLINYLLPVIFLVTLSFIDIKTFHLREGRIPSALTTVFICLAFILNPNPLNAIFAFLMGMLFVDLDLFGGIPDWKALTAGAIVLPNIFYVAIFGAFITFFGLIYKIMLKKTQPKEIPFIPVILFAYFAVVGVILLI